LKVSVVIVTHNRTKLCNLTLEYLNRQTIKPYEVVVVDAASVPPFRALKENYEYKLTILRVERDLGLGFCRNLGVIQSEGDIVAFIDDDAIPDANWIKEIIYHMIEYDADIVGGPCLPKYLGRKPSWWNSRVLGCYLAVYNTFIVGCNLAIKREVFDKVGLFKVHLGRIKELKISNEDVDFIFRANKKGAKITYCGRIRVYHFVMPNRLSLRYLVKRAWYQGVSIYLMLGHEFMTTIMKERKLYNLLYCRHVKRNHLSYLDFLRTRAFLLRILLLIITAIGILYAAILVRKQRQYTMSLQPFRISRKYITDH